MTLMVHLFARAKELANADAVSLDLRAGATVADVRRALLERHPALQPILAVSMIAVNHEFASEVQTLSAGDEVAIIPPVSGGSPPPS